MANPFHYHKVTYIDVFAVFNFLWRIYVSFVWCALLKLELGTSKFCQSRPIGIKNKNNLSFDFLKKQVAPVWCGKQDLNLHERIAH